MPTFQTLKTLVVLTLATGALGACTFNKVDTGVFRIPAENQGRVLVEVPAFEGLEPVRVNYADLRTTEEYVLYRSQQGQAEAFFAETLPFFRERTILDFNKLAASTIPMWRFNQGQELQLGNSFPVSNDFADFWVQPYQQKDAGRQCAGFMGQWEIRMDDPDLRPSKIMFGYFCAPKGTKFNNEDAAQLVKSLQIRGISVPLRVASAYALNKETPPPSRDVQTSNLVLAQDGAGGGVAGLPDFPLLITRLYNNYDNECTNC